MTPARRRDMHIRKSREIRQTERSAETAAPGEISAFSFCQHFVEK